LPAGVDDENVDLVPMKILVYAALILTLAHHAVAGADDAHAQLVEKAHATYERDLERASRHPFREFEKAVEDGDLNAVKRMLDGGLPVDLQIPCPADEWEGIPPSEPAIHKAVRTGNLEMARLLLDRGAGASARDSEGTPPLHHVRNVDMATLLLSRGAKVSARDDDGWQAIHTAASGDLDLVKMLIKHGADPLAETANKTQPIHQAAERATPEMVAFFLSKGAKVDAVIRSEEGFVHNGWTALHLAANRMDDAEKAEKVCRLLLAKGANPNALTDEGATPLHLSRSAAITRLLLEHEAKPDVMSTGISKNQPIHMEMIRLIRTRLDSRPKRPPHRR